MSTKTILTVCLFCFLLAFLSTTFVSPIYAAPPKLKTESKTGLSEVFKSRDATGVGPSKTQLVITFGATVIMIGVLKYL